MYRYRQDPPNNKSIHTLSYPPFSEILNVRYKDMISRFFPISTIYIKHRLLLDRVDILNGFKKKCQREVELRDLKSDMFYQYFVQYCYQHLRSHQVDMKSDLSNGITVEDLSPYLNENDIRECLSVLSYQYMKNGQHMRSRDEDVVVVNTNNSVLINSIVGSCLSQEVIKVISLVGEPMFNIYVYDGSKFEGLAFPVLRSYKVMKQSNATTPTSTCGNIANKVLDINEVCLLEDEEEKLNVEQVSKKQKL